MRPTSIIGLLLIVGGLVVLLMGGFSYTKSDKVLDIGPLEATVQTQERVPLPPLAGGLGHGRRRRAAAGRPEEKGVTGAPEAPAKA